MIAIAPRADPLIAEGAAWADSPKALAARCDAVITCLPSPAVSEAVLAGPDGILAGLAKGGAWIEMSTLGRDEIQRLAALAAAKGIAVLECPVTGGVHQAADGEITVLVGGDTALFERHQPALQAMGGEIFHMGPLGSAAVIKVITNMLAFIHLVAEGEALMLAKTRRPRPGPGVPRDPRQLRQQLRARDRKPADPQRQLRHRFHHGSRAARTSASPWA